MKKETTFRNYLVDFSILMHILLFSYAALSKAMDFSHFQAELAKSPILSAYADYLPAVLIATEFFLVLLLLLPSLRRYGLLASFGLMIGFTTYIIIILNWSSFIPCSCGGILSKLGWGEHLVFNLIFVLLAMVGFLMYPSSVGSSRKMIKERLFLLLATGTFFTVLVTILFLTSEDKTHRNNGFIRRYPHQPAKVMKGYDVQLNSYYLAGVAEGTVYLGNITAPSHILAIDTTLTLVRENRIVLNESDSLRMAAPIVSVIDDTFFLSDAETGYIFRGTTADWFGHQIKKGAPFLQFKPLCADTIAVTYLSPETGGSRIAFHHISTDTIVYDENTKNLREDVFATDGILLANTVLKKVIYLYYYRNEFLTASTDFKEQKTHRSIDTLQKSKLPVTYEMDRGIRSLTAGVEMIHVQGATAGRYLFIKSNRLGRYESATMLDDASIIDVYDIQKQTYEFSFYLYNYRDEKVKSFMIYNNILVGLTNHYLVLYRLDSNRFDFGL